MAARLHRAGRPGVSPGSTRGTRDREHGFTMLVVLLVAAVAALASASLVAAVLSASVTDAADRGRDACAAAADAGITRLVEQLRWGAAGENVAFETADDEARPSVATSLQVSAALAAPDGTSFSRLQLVAASSAGAARVARRLEVRVRPGALPQGLAAAGDLVALAPVEVGGCGVYVGGDVRGREHIAFLGAAEPASPAPDLLYPDLYSAAAVHAAGSISTAEGEIHDLPAPTLDTDVHVGEPFAAGLSTLPGAAHLALLEGHAAPVGPALAGDELCVDLLPAQPDDGADPGAGLVVYVPAGAHPGPLLVTGRRPPPPLACPLVLVVEGEAVLGGPSEGSPDASSASLETAPEVVDEPLADSGEVSCELYGAVLATAGVSVAAPTRLWGSLAGAGVVVAAPLRLELVGAWLAWPPAGCRVFEVMTRS